MCKTFIDNQMAVSKGLFLLHKKACFMGLHSLHKGNAAAFSMPFTRETRKRQKERRRKYGNI